jgi:hypothetical protein
MLRGLNNEGWAGMPEPHREAAGAKAEPGTYRVAMDQLSSATLRKGLDLWTRKRGARRFPSRADMQPRDMAEFLRQVVLVRVLPGAEDFQFRVVGDAIAQAQGASYQGLTLSEIDRLRPGYGDALGRAYRSVCRWGEPTLYRGSVVAILGEKAITHESLLLPLSDNGVMVDHILLVAVYSIESRVAPNL